MSGLPCLRRGTDWWRLPLSRQANDLLAAMMLAGRCDNDSHRDLVSQLVVDPPLLIFAAISVGVDPNQKADADESKGHPQTLAVDEIGWRFAERLWPIFAADCSDLHPTTRTQQSDSDWYGRLERLRRSFLRLPIQRWLSAAGKWFELVGPPVPRQWAESWPTIVDSKAIDGDDFGDAVAAAPRHSGETLSYYPSALDLPTLARRMLRAEGLLETFDSELRSAKRAALRQFAYGLSHEINNPLANISTRAQTLVRGETDAGRQQSLQRIVDQAMRAHEMTADLMFYAHPPQPKRSRFDLRKAVDSVVKQAADAVSGRAIQWTTIRSNDPVMVDADHTMITEALRGLLRNSAEAIGCDGQVQVECRVEPKASLAQVKICDSGPGLTPSAAEHAFDPYFSGREAGRGLGVGLCRVQTIAKIHGGGVELTGGSIGCVARLWIPVAT